jgi:hypothetical protein
MVKEKDRGRASMCQRGRMREVFGRGEGRDLMMNGLARGLSLIGGGGAAVSC